MTLYEHDSFSPRRFTIVARENIHVNVVRRKITKAVKPFSYVVQRTGTYRLWRAINDYKSMLHSHFPCTFSSYRSPSELIVKHFVNISTWPHIENCDVRIGTGNEMTTKTVNSPAKTLSNCHFETGTRHRERFVDS